MYPCLLNGNGKELYKLLLEGLSFSWGMWSDFQARLKSSETCPQEPLWREVEVWCCPTSKLAKHCAVASEQRETSWLLLSCHFGFFIYVVNCFVKYSIIGFLPRTHGNIHEQNEKDKTVTAIRDMVGGILLNNSWSGCRLSSGCLVAWWGWLHMMRLHRTEWIITLSSLEFRTDSPWLLHSYAKQQELLIPVGKEWALGVVFGWERILRV